MLINKRTDFKPDIFIHGKLTAVICTEWSLYIKMHKSKK